jgi:hypothetical protein
MTPYQGRFAAGSKAGAKRVWLQQWDDGQVSSRSVQDGEVFDGFEVWYAPCMDNHDADHLAWIASCRAPTLSDVIVKKLSKPLVKLEELISEATMAGLMIIDEPVQQPAYDWMSSIRAYLDNQPPSYDNAEVECIMCKSRMYHLIDGVLYQ